MFLHPRPELFGGVIKRDLDNEHYFGELGPASRPPSRTKDWPVMKDAWSEHIHTTASAISVGFPKRDL
jgi:hypothetical protein